MRSRELVKAAASDAELSPPDLTEHQAAERLNVSVYSLRKWRQQSRGPVYMQVEGCIRYSPADLDRYRAASRRQPATAA
jgi:hypothetical protein